MKFYKKTFFVVIVFCWFCQPLQLFADEDLPKVVILFDQSASIKDYDSNFYFKEWLMNFIRTLQYPYELAIIGFDDQIHEYLRIAVNNKKDISTVKNTLGKIRAKGMTTDFEVPFSYLLESVEPDSKIIAIIVSDGEPEIWDEKRWYLSAKIRSYSRYEDLNKQYRSMKSKGISFKEIYRKLNPPYKARNLEFIKEKLAAVGEKLGDKLIFLDISGEFPFFQRWAETANAKYILMPEQGEGILPNELIGFTTLLRENASVISQKSLPEDRKQGLEGDRQNGSTNLASPTVPKDTALLETGGKPQEQKTQISSKIPLEIEEVKETVQNKGMAVIYFSFPVIIIAAYGLLIFFQKRKKLRLEKLAVTSLEGATKYIDSKIGGIIDDADKWQVEMLKSESNLVREERRFSVRIPVPHGAMQVYWKDNKGGVRFGSVINISMNGILFHAPGFDGESIDFIKCPGSNREFHLVHSRAKKREPELAVAILDEFKDNTNTRMKWIEIFTRMEE